MPGSGEKSERASVAPILAAKAGSRLGDLHNGSVITVDGQCQWLEEFWSEVAICSLNRARHAQSSDFAASLILIQPQDTFSCLNSSQRLLPLHWHRMFPGSMSTIAYSLRSLCL